MEEPSSEDDNGITKARRFFNLAGGFTVLGAVAVALTLLVCVSRRPATRAGSRGDEPIPGVSLRPSKTALPAFPSAALVPSSDMAPRVASPPPRKFKQPTVVFGMLIKNMDYARLVTARNFYEAFNATVKQAVASEAGSGIESSKVELAVSPGSVVVECTIAVGSAEVANDVQIAVGSSTRLAAELGMNLRVLSRMDRFQSVSVGQIEVAHVSFPAVYGTQTPTTSTTGLPTTTRATRPTTPPPELCRLKGATCFLDSDCCSGRCSAMHRCAMSLAQFR